MYSIGLSHNFCEVNIEEYDDDDEVDLHEE